ncbi:hypothetical protein KKC83_00355 [Patescibacteria group bacterium]|nr:hypothetical protein [Candidatus Falkowbacteria bacterium]MBU3905794.1 hypothetical protein [Patescibacteria group bacterium]MCG2697668.1 hypothetical protein [Candidatus Parcubacteria bacterium]MBU4015411.1 hypothetical protein [Patescibacteria group bacterium]MBU4025989.1 hypothetical protein [Patescibacteria group bacterium]
MSKTLIKISSAKPAKAKLVSWHKAIHGSPIKLAKDSHAGVIIDKQGTPQMFVFDTFAFLDILSEIDDRLADKLSHKEYHSKTDNPAGWLIDEIEAKLPVNPGFVQSLKNSIKEADKKGWVPFSKIQADLGLT